MTSWQGTPRSAALVLGGVLVVLAAAGCVERRDDPAPSATRPGPHVGGAPMTARAEGMTQPGAHVRGLLGLPVRREDPRKIRLRDPSSGITHDDLSRALPGTALDGHTAPVGRET